jgi:small conductance mechanosensitive channel
VASFSLISLAVGIGAQNLVKDIITGLFIILEDTVSVGDYVTLDSLTGHVEALTIRTIALRAEDGTLHTIPFSSITRVSNLTRQYAVVVSLVAIGYEQPLEPAFAAIRTAYQNLANDPRIAKWLLGKFEIKGVDEFRDNGIIIKSLIQTVVLRHNDVKRAFNLELKKVFDQENIAFAHAEPAQHLVEIRNKPAPAVI